MIKSGILFLLFFSITLLLGLHFTKLFYLSIPSAFSGITSLSEFLHLSAIKFSTLVPGSDMSSYILDANSLLTRGRFIAGMIYTWPPGHPFFLFLLFKLTGFGDYPLKMLILEAVFLASSFTLIYFTLSHLKNCILKFFIAMLPLYFLVFNSYMFGMCMFMAESLSVPLFVMMLCFLVRWLNNGNVRELVISAVLLGILSYFRGYFELFGVFLLLVFILLLTFKAIKKKPLLTPMMKSFLIALVVFNVTLMPWRIHNFVQTHSFSWQHLEGQVWIAFWQPDSMWATGNVPCKINPKMCQFFQKNDLTKPVHVLSPNFYRNITLAMFMTHPIQWYGQKIKYFNVFWTGSASYFVITEGILVFFAGLGAIVMGCFFWQKKLPRESHYFTNLSLTFVVFNIGLFTFFHYETRYSLYLQVLFMYLPFWLLWGFKKTE